MKDKVVASPLRLFDSLLGARRASSEDAGAVVPPADAAQMPGCAADSVRSMDQQGLFIIGAARSGTTVLQNALNDSRDIFLLGEPCLDQDAGEADFAARYNAMHRAWGNQENKSTFCPLLFERDAPWYDYLQRLASLHRYVGSKIVVNPEHALASCQRLFDFHCRYFYRSHYVFTFRNPIDVLMSTRGLAELTGYQPASCESVLRGFLAVVALYIRMLRNLPSVTVAFHEDIGAPLFQTLGEKLGLDLSGAYPYYDARRVRRYTLEDIPAPSRELTAEVIELYETFREQANNGFVLTQLEQNSGHFDIGHYTPIGALDRRVQQLLSSL